jgi:hypothetical protein
MTYKSDISYLDSIINGANKYFYDYNLYFNVTDAWRSHFGRVDKTTSQTIDKFTNKTDITIAMLGRHKGKDIATAFIGQMGSLYGNIAIDVNYCEYSRTVLILCHELCHSLGMEHNNGKYNLMNNHTYFGELNSEQKKFLYRFGQRLKKKYDL